MGCELNDLAHSYRSLHIPPDAPFTLQPASGRGWGAFAITDIPQGAVILKEKPLFVIRKPHQMITEQDLRAAFQKMSASEKQQFSCIRDNATSPFMNMTDAFAEKSFAISGPGSGTRVHG
ncbi:hypothetical protein EJ02DRAFT_494161 [Clathrospora elynae]|uniref:SET domain-containing protein n=1 Tax=Clathrospora elynae TaxID=706981 RepID=A0A6A5SM53_9PLEO|nr:hypothetical protein EJ02DRAFT_494161 [Clathrospora elynae]